MFYLLILINVICESLTGSTIIACTDEDYHTRFFFCLKFRSYLFICLDRKICIGLWCVSMYYAEHL